MCKVRENHLQTCTLLFNLCWITFFYRKSPTCNSLDPLHTSMVISPLLHLTNSHPQFKTHLRGHPALVKQTSFLDKLLDKLLRFTCVTSICFWYPAHMSILTSTEIRNCLFFLCEMSLLSPSLP